MKYDEALKIAQDTLQELSPHCVRLCVAGSVRRQRPEVKDIEIVAIPKPYQTGLFADGIALVVNNWQKVKGELPCKYTQRILPSGIKLDLFFATRQNFGLIKAIRTGSAEYSHKVLATTWVQKGYKSIDGNLTYNGRIVDVPEEEHLFTRLGLKYIEPYLREVWKTN